MQIKDIQVKITHGDSSQILDVQMPAQEMFRVEEIFKNHGYSLPWYKRDDGSFTVVDVGANVGLFALYIHAQNPNATVHCYEPAPDTFRLLEQNTKTLRDYSINNYALSDKEGEFPFYCDPNNSGGHSLSNPVGRLPSSFNVPVKAAGPLLSQIKRDRIDVLKIDTEGSEIAILKSCVELLPKIDFVLLEYHSEADRRAIDQLLSDFVLFGSTSNKPNLGVLKYINRETLESAISKAT